MHILLVEDDAICAMVEKGLFEGLDCEVSMATSGEEAIDLIKRENSFDAIAMDIGLPHKNGIQTCIDIRAYEKENAKKTIAIIAVTSNADPKVESQCKAAGMQEVMAKLFTQEMVREFLSVINSK